MTQVNQHVKLIQIRDSVPLNILQEADCLNDGYCL